MAGGVAAANDISVRRNQRNEEKAAAYHGGNISVNISVSKA